ncbi:hypothetical protein [Anaeromicropila herbilytica]|uniref:Uncharacterized protein n=1 Tax=Anaeromicropila herbilytica TaxID=2785025 RepID=A0A7R7EHZ3_9FIRM|nr:hypothetical protein [Anaeromicropila herbilytica]BCN29085.1 hypothetical protein bsdtb5_03800 [Anaeromicropila herbilytica]
MRSKELLNELQVIINQTRIVACISPGSIDETIYKKCYKANKNIESNVRFNKNDLIGFSRPYADKYGYNAPLLEHISRMEKLIEME